MKSLYNNIYKAISEGVIKSLQIDDPENSSVNYRQSNITNTMNMIPYYVSEIIAGNDIKNNYTNICNLFGKTRQRYKVKDIQQLLNIYNQIRSCLNFDDISQTLEYFNLDWIDTTDALTFITTNNKEMPLHEINHISNIEFIKFNNIENCDHPIIINKKIMQRNFEKWHYSAPKKFIAGKCFNNYEEAKLDFNGFDNTYYNADIIVGGRDEENYPAFQYVINLKDNIVNKHYLGYLPALGELLFLGKCGKSDFINYILSIVNGKDYFDKFSFKPYLSFYKENGWWSSTEMSKTIAYIMNINLDASAGNKAANQDNEYGYSIIPLFEKVN